MAGADLPVILALSTSILGGAVLVGYLVAASRSRTANKEVAPKDGANAAIELLPCIRARRSVFPQEYVDREIDESTVGKLLEAAMWAPFHGSRPPWRFVVLGRSAMIEMQDLTLEYYDKNWAEVFTARLCAGANARH
jgi:hypothetical protein